MRTYNKPHKTIEEQVQLLRERGLIIDDEQRAIKHLRNISYYRLSAYMLPYKVKEDNLIRNQFRKEVTWNMIYDLYLFDRKLRILVFDIIERLEIAFRTQIIYQLAEKYDSHWQDKKEIFKKPAPKKLHDGRNIAFNIFEQIQKHIKEQMQSNKAEVFIKHYKNNYDNPTNPPSWMCVEVMYFNHLSQICNNLKNRADINGISKYFDLPPEIFKSWLHTINYVRNLCAHHSRLWNRDLSIVPQKLKFSNKKRWITNAETAQRGKIYYFLCMLNYLQQTTNPNSSFKPRLFRLLEDYKHVVNLSAMGFPEDWTEEKIWNNG